MQTRRRGRTVDVMELGMKRSKAYAQDGKVDCDKAMVRLALDKHWAVRGAAAAQGAGLDLLIQDDNNYVRNKAFEYLRAKDLTLEQWKTANPALCALGVSWA